MAEGYTTGPLEIDNADTAKVVELPNLVTGRLADLIASAAAPGGRHELHGEQAVREVFRSEVESAPRVQRQWWRRPAIVVAASAASIMIASTSLAAATGDPGPVAHIVVSGPRARRRHRYRKQSDRYVQHRQYERGVGGSGRSRETSQ